MRDNSSFEYLQLFVSSVYIFRHRLDGNYILHFIFHTHSTVNQRIIEKWETRANDCPPTNQKRGKLLHILRSDEVQHIGSHQSTKIRLSKIQIANQALKEREKLTANDGQRRLVQHHEDSSNSSSSILNTENECPTDANISGTNRNELPQSSIQQKSQHKPICTYRSSFKQCLMPTAAKGKPLQSHRSPALAQSLLYTNGPSPLRQNNLNLHKSTDIKPEGKSMFSNALLSLSKSTADSSTKKATPQSCIPSTFLVSCYCPQRFETFQVRTNQVMTVKAFKERIISSRYASLGYTIANLSVQIKGMNYDASTREDQIYIYSDLGLALGDFIKITLNSQNSKAPQQSSQVSRYSRNAAVLTSATSLTGKGIKYKASFTEQQLKSERSQPNMLKVIKQDASSLKRNAQNPYSDANDEPLDSSRSKNKSAQHLGQSAMLAYMQGREVIQRIRTESSQSRIRQNENCLDQSFGRESHNQSFSDDQEKASQAPKILNLKNKRSKAGVLVQQAHSRNHNRLVVPKTTVILGRQQIDDDKSEKSPYRGNDDSRNCKLEVKTSLGSQVYVKDNQSSKSFIQQFASITLNMQSNGD